MSGSDDDEMEEEVEENETEEDRQFIDDDGDDDDGNSDETFYRRVDALTNDDAQTADDDAAPIEKEKKKRGREGYIFPLRMAPEVRKRHVNLLCIEDPDEDGKFHYCAIRNFSGLVRGQYNQHGSHNLHFCYRCLHGFYAKKGERTRESCVNLQDHPRYCKTIKPQRVTYPQNKKEEF